MVGAFTLQNTTKQLVLSDGGNHPCPFCGGSLSTRLVHENIPFKTPDGEVTLSADVPYDTCAECGYEGFGEAGERARTEAVYRYVGRLTPWEIVRLRENLDLSQNAFAEWLGVGRASLERWERGGNMQNQSMDNLILLLSNHAHKSWLDSERRRRLKVNTDQSSIVSLQRFRALRPDNSDQLAKRARTFKLRR